MRSLHSTGLFFLPNFVGKRKRWWHPTPVLLPGKSHGWRSLVGSSPWGREESDTTKRPHFHFSLSCIGEGNGNPLQCSCLENPRDGEPGGLPSMGLHRVRHDWSDLAAAAVGKARFYSESSCCNVTHGCVRSDSHETVWNILQEVPYIWMSSIPKACS